MLRDVVLLGFAVWVGRDVIRYVVLHCLLHCVSKQEKAHTIYVLFAPRLGVVASCRRLFGLYLFVVVVLGCCGRFRLLPRLLMRALLVASIMCAPKKLFFLSCWCVPSILRSSLNELLIHPDSFSLLTRTHAFNGFHHHHQDNP